MNIDLLIGHVEGMILGGLAVYSCLKTKKKEPLKQPPPYIEPKVLFDSLIERADYWARTKSDISPQLVMLLNEIAGALKHSLSNTQRR